MRKEKKYSFGDQKPVAPVSVRTTAECCGQAKFEDEGGEIETAGMLMGVQLRPKSCCKEKVNDNFIFHGKVVPEFHPKTESEDQKGGLEKLKPGREQADCEM